MDAPVPTVKYSHPWYAKPGVVYFLAAGAPPRAIKIGVSTDEAFEERKRAIQSANHERIEVIGLIRFDRGENALPMLEAERRERQLHQQFREYGRSPSGTVGQEWFNPAPELLKFIRENTADRPAH